MDKVKNIMGRWLALQPLSERDRTLATYDERVCSTVGKRRLLAIGHNSIHMIDIARKHFKR